MNEGEKIGFAEMQDMPEKDRQLFLSPKENWVLGSSVAVNIAGSELKIVDDETKQLEGDSMRMSDAHKKDLHAVNSPKGLQTPSPMSLTEVNAKRLGKKVNGSLVALGAEAVLASLQGIETGIIPCDLNENGEAEFIRMYFAKGGKLVKPEEIGADNWVVNSSNQDLLQYVRTDPDGTMIFR